MADVGDAIGAAFEKAVGSRAVAGVVAAASVDGRTVFEGAFGSREIGGAVPMTADTVFWIASMTKAITAAGAMQLVEQGKLALDAPIAAVLPELADRPVLEGFDETGAPKLRPARGPITLRHLLTHTAGFAYDMWSADIKRYMEREAVPGVISCRREALKTPLIFDPGTRWHYGINIDFVGLAIERVSGQTLGQYLTANLFEPLGMRDTGFRLRPDMRDRLARMHVRGPDGSLTAIDFEIPQSPDFEMGGGGLYGTVGDYLAFTRMILDGGRGNGQQVLRPETVAEMSRNAMGEVSMERMVSAVPGSTNDVDLYPGMVKKWGLSFMINTEQVPGARSAGSLSWAGLGNTYYWIDPARRISGVIATQTLPFADPAVLGLYDAFERGVYQAAGAA